MEFTKQQIDDFLAELNALPSSEQKTLFLNAIKKEAVDITELEGRAIIAYANWLSDDERYKFKDLLVEENLSKEERKRWLRLYPRRTDFGKQISSSYFNKMFPKRKEIEKHYKKNFLKGRTKK